MSNYKTKIFIIGSLGLYFGWMLSFPFHGPIYTVVSNNQGMPNTFAVLAFMMAHTITHIILGLFLRQISIWYRMMVFSLAATIVANVVLVINTPWIWHASMIVMGVASSVFILGWSVVFSLSDHKEERLRIMASTIILANLVLVTFYILTPWITINNYIFLSFIPLIMTSYLLKTSPSHIEFNFEKTYAKQTVPKHLLFILFLFIFNIYLNGGFMYTMMLPSLRMGGSFIPYYPYMLYSIVLVLMCGLNKRISNVLMVYLGISLLGLAFVSFALLNEYVSGYIMTIGLMETSFALLDLFLWTSLGFLALKYDSPYQFFGLILGANTLSIIAGNLISKNLSNVANNRYLITALLSAASIFLAIMVVPWLIRKINTSQNHSSKTIAALNQSHNSRLYQHLLSHLPHNVEVTERESEVIQLVLKGMTNKDMANELFISEHTIKTHLKNICVKFGVSRKKDLVYLASQMEDHSN